MRHEPLPCTAQAPLRYLLPEMRSRAVSFQLSIELEMATGRRLEVSVNRT